MPFNDFQNSRQSEEYSMVEQDRNYPPAEIDGPPPLPIDLHEHKLSIFINWGVILLTSCIAPLVLYPTLHWGANLSLKICLCSICVSKSPLSMSCELTPRYLKISFECS
jgi:hypothetical protein